VLADCVHNFDPHYSKFKHQCFWFSSIICDVVAKEYNCTMVSSNSNENSLSTDLPTPCKLMQQLSTGRWGKMDVHFDKRCWGEWVERRDLQVPGVPSTKNRGGAFWFLFLTANCWNPDTDKRQMERILFLSGGETSPGASETRLADSGTEFYFKSMLSLNDESGCPYCLWPKHDHWGLPHELWGFLEKKDFFK
jgi:hypothetical protein